MPASKFTKANRDKLLRQLRRGKPLNASAASAGIGVTTLKDWRAKGEAATEKIAKGEKVSAVDRAYAAFNNALVDARFYGQSFLWDRWYEEAEKERRGNWMAYERQLISQFPADFRPTVQKGELTMKGKDGKTGGTIEIKLAFEPDEQLADDLAEK